MKKLKLSLQNFEGAEMLDKSQLKMIMGGSVDDAPSSPSGGDGGGSGISGSTYKCCWNNHMSVCSVCVPCTSTCTCVYGASLVAC